MAYRQTSYQYETSPRKLKPEYEVEKNPYSKKKTSTLKPKQSPKIEQNNQTNQAKKEKKGVKAKVKTVVYILVGFAILFAISYRHSLITESFNKKEQLKKQLSLLQKENAQTEISIQSSLNLSNIQKAASEMLGMQKIHESQKVYVNLPKKDYVEAAGEQVTIGEEQNWVQKLLDSIKSIIK